MHALDVEALTVGYGPSGTPALQSLDFTVAPGRFVGIVGESGSGKTTLGMTIAGFLGSDGGRIISGRLSVLGSEVKYSTRRQSRLPRRTPKVAMMFQDAMSSLDPVSRVGDQIRDVVHAAGGPKGRRADQRAVEILEQVGIHDPEQVRRQRPYQLSGGMRQRVMLGLVLASEPEIIVADEPTSALDVRLTALTMQLLTSVSRRRSTTLVVITHDLHLVRAYLDEVIVLDKGRIVDRGETAEVYANPRSDYTRGLVESNPTLDAHGLHRLPVPGATAAANA
jgi:ABC-type glutathione transport system ATPase component